MNTPGQPPETPEALLQSLQRLTDDSGHLSAETVASANNSRQFGIPAKPLRAIVLAVQEVIPQIDILFRYKSETWGALGQLLAAAEDLAGCCQAQVTGQDDQHTYRLQDHWDHVDSVLYDAKTAADHFRDNPPPRPELRQQPISDLVAEFAKGKTDPAPEAHIVDLAERLAKAAVNHTKSPEMSVDSEGVLTFDLRRADRQLFSAELHPDGQLIISVYNNRTNPRRPTTHRSRATEAQFYELLIVPAMPEDAKPKETELPSAGGQPA